MTSPPTTRGERARDRLLRAASDELISSGELEVANVARRAGVSAGLPYRYFGTRTGLLNALVDRFYDGLDQACGLVEYDEATWAARERRRTRDWVDFLYREPLAPTVLTGLVGDGGVAATHARRTGRLIALAAGSIARAQRDGELPAGRDPELLAAATIGGLNAVAAVALTRDPRPGAGPVADEVWACIAGAVGLPHTSPTSPTSPTGPTRSPS